MCAYLRTYVFAYVLIYTCACLHACLNAVGWLGERWGGLLFTPLMLSLDGLSGIKGCCLCHPSPSSGHSSQHLGDLILLLMWDSPVPHCSQTLELGDKGGYVRGWQL